MKVRCIANSLNGLKRREEAEWLTSNGFVNRSGDSELIINKGIVYVVFGIVFWNNAPFYYICEGDNYKYPIPYYAGFFEIIDDRMSKYWKLVHNVHSDEYIKNTGKIHETFLVFDEWAKDKMFYENLLNGEQKEEEIFAKYRKLMDEE